ncbi:zinc finger and BTB domain-containing protein 22 [Elephas maximus indicus]|uniref:zinc finger and BTB domain-containing protein 22 n=1 Tax=Elephas maximus indicus TaxID=99487 RepID=UPI00211600A2|nr:zinc finger and BTB domain-containing protein 22 [Elephas maximus indicus]
MEPSSLSPSATALPLPLPLAQPPLPAAAVVHVSFPEVTSALLESLNQQRLQGQLCDVSIRVQGREFRAHRAVLAASSPYFHDQVLLKGMTSISLPSVMDPGAFETVLASAYTGRLSMAAADIVNFLTVGSVLQMWHIVDKCTELLREGRTSATTTITTSAATSVTVHGPAGSGSTVAPATMGSVRAHASSRASENQSPSSSNYFSPRESTDFSSSSQEAFAASTVGSGERRGGGPVFPAPVVVSGGATSGKLLLEADELCDDGGDGRGAVVPGAGLRRPTYAPPSIMPQKHWVYVKQGGNCPAPAPLVPQDPDLEEEEEEEDLVLTCEDDEDEELGGGSGIPAGGGPEATLSISDVRTLSEPPVKGEEQVNFCESSNDFGPYEGGGPGAGLDDSGGPTPSSYTPSHPPRPLLPLDMQANQILVFPSSSSSQAPGQPPGNQAEHGAVTLGGTSAGGLSMPGGTGGTSGGTGGTDGNKIFLCHCGKAFSHKSMRDRHVNMHLNLRPFDCPVCNKKFKMKHHLTEHMKTHTGLKPYECGVCAKKFMWRDSFMRHRGHCERRHRLGGGGPGGGAGPGPPAGPAMLPKRESQAAGGGSGDERSGATSPPSGRVWSPTSVHKVEMGFNGGGGAN